MHKIILATGITGLTFTYIASITSSCPLPVCNTNQQTIGQPILGCNTRMQQLIIDNNLIVNGTACFNGSLIICSGPAPCFCWNGLLCTGLSSPETIPSSCTLDEGNLLFNATSPEQITLVLFSRITKDNTNASCKLASLQSGDTIRLSDTDDEDTFANLEVVSRITSGTFYGLQLTGGVGTGIFLDNDCICLDNFGPISSTTGSAAGLGNYIQRYKDTAQNAIAAWTDITFDFSGEIDGAWLPTATTVTCPEDGVYLIDYTLQYGLDGPPNNVTEVVSTRILEDGVEINGSQASIVPRRDGNFSPGRPQRCLKRTIIVQLSAGAVLRLQHISLGIVGIEGRIQPGGTSDNTPISGTLTIMRIG